MLTWAEHLLLARKQPKRKLTSVSGRSVAAEGIEGGAFGWRYGHRRKNNGEAREHVDCPHPLPVCSCVSWLSHLVCLVVLLLLLLLVLLLARPVNSCHDVCPT